MCDNELELYACKIGGLDGLELMGYITKLENPKQRGFNHNIFEEI